MTSIAFAVVAVLVALVLTIELADRRWGRYADEPHLGIGDVVTALCCWLRGGHDAEIVRPTSSLVYQSRCQSCDFVLDVYDCRTDDARIQDITYDVADTFGGDKA